MNHGDLVPLLQHEGRVEGERAEGGGEEASQPQAGHDVGEAVGLYGVNICQNLKTTNNLGNELKSLLRPAAVPGVWRTGTSAEGRSESE